MASDILAVDIGTSSCKAAVFSLEGELLALGKGSYSLLFPEEGYVEQDPEELFEGVQEAVRQLNEQGIDLSGIKRADCSPVSG